MIESTLIKRQKETIEWIEAEHPDGLRVLERIAKYPTSFAELISKALVDLHVLEKRAALIFEQDVREYSEKEEEIEMGIAEFEERLAEAARQKQLIINEIESQKDYGEMIGRDYTRLRAIMTPVRIKSESGEASVPVRDRAEIYNAETAQLETELEELQDRLMELTREQARLLRRG